MLGAALWAREERPLPVGCQTEEAAEALRWLPRGPPAWSELLFNSQRRACAPWVPGRGGCREARRRRLQRRSAPVAAQSRLWWAAQRSPISPRLAIQALAADEIKNAELKAAEEKRAAEATAAATLSALEAKREAALAKAAEERERALAAAAKREGEARRAVEEKAAQLALLKREKRVAAEKKRAADKRRHEASAATAAEVCTHSRHGLGKWERASERQEPASGSQVQGRRSSRSGRRASGGRGLPSCVAHASIRARYGAGTLRGHTPHR